jgi:hypothetical protein
MSEVLRVANCSGFYGDRLSAARDMVEGGPIDVLTGDYLAELTMLILWKTRERGGGRGGFAATFLRQLEEVLGTCLDRGIRIVVNAGGLNPSGLADAVRELGDRLGLCPAVAHIEGDDVLPRLAQLQAAGHRFEHLDRGVALADAGIEPVTANAYLGAWGIAEALGAGADIVVCPRVTDASLVVGPAAWHFGWRRDDWDALAGAVVAGHVIECGPQATGGNYAFLGELPDYRYPGFPIAEMHADGSCVITKHPGTGGLVSVGTVTAQLLYEIGGPRYPNPDVVARFDTIFVEQEAPDRVRVGGVRGEPAPADAKVAINYLGGYRNTMTFVLTGLDIEAKAAMAESMLWGQLGGRERFGSSDVQLNRISDTDALLRVTVKDADQTKVDRAFSSAVIELALASYAGFHTTSPPSRASSYGVYWPALLPAREVAHVAVLPDGSRVDIAHTPPSPASLLDIPPAQLAGVPRGPTRRVPLGTIAGARSGDKGGNANVGLWARSDAAYAWLADYLTVERFRSLVTETADLEVQRYELANLRALNFVVVGLLGEGVASSVRSDPQAKSLGEYVRSRLVDMPEALLTGERR